MLRKRGRTVEKEQGKMTPDSSPSSDYLYSSNGAAQKAKNSSFFSVPRLLVGFSTKCLSDCDAARSPTSPLDYKVLSSLGSSFLGSPRSPGPEAKSKCWDNSRVGLGLVDSLNDENKPCGNVFLESKKCILFAPQMRMSISSTKSHLDGSKHEKQSMDSAPRSLPKNYGILPHKLGVEKRTLANDFDCRELGILGSSLPASRFMCHCPKANCTDLNSESNSFFKVDSSSSVKDCNFEGSIPVSTDSSHELVSVLSASDIEQSEDYTCIISHGPNPRRTRVFGDFILESSCIDLPSSNGMNGTQVVKSFWLLESCEDSSHGSASDFLSSCFSCNMKLEEGKDIYMYRGEKAFCSCECRDKQILNEEEMEKFASNSSDSAILSFDEEIFPTPSIFEH